MRALFEKGLLFFLMGARERSFTNWYPFLQDACPPLIFSFQIILREIKIRLFFFPSPSCCTSFGQLIATPPPSLLSFFGWRAPFFANRWPSVRYKGAAFPPFLGEGSPGSMSTSIPPFSDLRNIDIFPPNFKDPLSPRSPLHFSATFLRNNGPKIDFGHVPDAAPSTVLRNLRLLSFFSAGVFLSLFLWAPPVMLEVPFFRPPPPPPPRSGSLWKRWGFLFFLP